jgi:hypothetical protein
MSTIIRKARNKADEPVAPNPQGKRLCDRSALLLVPQVEQPHFAPRAAQPARKGSFAAMYIIEAAS